MPTPEEFRRRLGEVDRHIIVEEFLLTEPAEHVNLDMRRHIGARVCSAYATPQEDLGLWIVGSAKLGFSLSEKSIADGIVLPRYRSFRPESDIDVAIVHPAIFQLIWGELTDYAHRADYWPWNSGRLGDYLVCGWLRPDHFPRGVRLRRCDQWWDCFRAMSNEVSLGRRKIRGGLFQSREQLARYLRRAVDDCVNAEEMSK